MRSTPAAASAIPYRGSAAEWATNRLAAYFDLTKPRITALILLVTVAGFWLGSRGAPDGYRLMATIAGIGALAAGMFALNQYFERHLDALMSRTSDRPLPAGRLRPRDALVFGVALCAASVAFLALMVNVLTGVVAAATIGSYLFVYTPLKTKTPHCTLIGAFPGAVPPLVGWVAARGELGAEAWTLFAILFLWQFPHFHSIAWLYRDDYARAGIRLWPVVEPQGATTAMQVVGSTLLLVPVSVLPGLLEIAGATYVWGALAMGVGFSYFGLRTALGNSRGRAQRLLLASVVYLPALFILMMLGRS